jgi:catalase
VPAIVRFSNTGGDPASPDAVRGMSVKFLEPETDL